MSIKDGPKIVTDGLVLALDAGNRFSYPGSGTTWSDLSGNGYNGTLTNGPTYSNGSIVFDGVDDYWSTSTPSTLKDHTIMGFVNISTLVGKDWICIFEFFDGSLTKTHYYVQGLDNPYPSFRQGFGANFVNTKSVETWESTNLVNMVPNQWTMLTGRVDGNSGDTFINTSKSKPTRTLSGWDSAMSITSLKNIRINSSLEFNGQLGNVLFYNRALTDAEITQNYNATKGRFGL